MVKRANSFARALKFAETSLQKAMQERTRCQRKVAELDTEIPRLQQIIASLSGKEWKHQAKVEEIKAIMETGSAPPPNLSPEDLAKWYADRDLSSVGSIPPERPVAPSVPVSEDDLLPDDFEVK